MVAPSNLNKFTNLGLELVDLDKLGRIVQVKKSTSPELAPLSPRDTSQIVERLKEINFFDEIIKRFAVIYRPSKKLNLVNDDNTLVGLDDVFQKIKFPEGYFSFANFAQGQKSTTRVIGQGKASITNEAEFLKIVAKVMGSSVPEQELYLQDLELFLSRLGLAITRQNFDKRIWREELLGAKEDLANHGIFYREADNKFFLVAAGNSKNWSDVKIKALQHAATDAKEKNLTSFPNQAFIKALSNNARERSHTEVSLKDALINLGFNVADDAELMQFVDTNDKAREFWETKVNGGDGRELNHYTHRVGLFNFLKKLKEKGFKFISLLNLSKDPGGLPLKFVLFKKDQAKFLAGVASTSSKGNINVAHLKRNLDVLKEYVDVLNKYLSEKVRPLFALVNFVDVKTRQGDVSSVFQVA